jgi:hypothetical protein
LLSGLRRRDLDRPPGRLGFGLLKDTHNLGLKFRKIEREHRTAWMEDEVATLGKHRDVEAQSLAHSALDAIALMGFAHYFAGCESYPRARRARIGLRLLRGEEPTHRGRLALAARAVGALIISVLLQAQASQRLALGTALGLALIWFWRGLPAGLVLGVVRVARLGHHGYAG